MNKSKIFIHSICMILFVCLFFFERPFRAADPSGESLKMTLAKSERLLCV